MKVFTAPDVITSSRDEPHLFLGGTIENGTAVDWQQSVLQTLSHKGYSNLNVLNPRRANWNSNPSSIELQSQILWELQAIDRSDSILINLLDDTLSPISLLELGLCAGQNSMGMPSRCVVCCSSQFWRYTNVRLVTERYHVSLVETLSEALEIAVMLAYRNRERRTTPIPSSVR